MSEHRLEKALTAELVDTIRELQSLSRLDSFSVAGGTNLALRFNHRKSVDIDLFSNQVVGTTGLSAIKSQLKSFYGNNILACELVNAELGNQYCFLKALIRKEALVIKVEVIQNIPLLDPVETLEGTLLLSLKDIGLLKLMSASNRKAAKRYL